MKLALNPIYIARFHRGFPLSFATAWIAYQGGKAPRVLPFANGKHKGDLHVHDAIRCVACIVAAGIFRVPRCRWADSPFADNRRHFIGHALLQKP
jgi:hypothetical protein